MDTPSLQRLLEDLGLSEVRYYPSVGSTNDAAQTLARAGAAEPALVAADAQQAGRGRSGRKWITTPGAALAFSLLLRPTAQEAALLPRFSALAALAVCDALADALNLHAEIKWPNDVLLNRRKTAGVLIEPVFAGSTLEWLVAGIGINIAPPSVPPAEMLEFPATCVETEAGVPVERWSLLRQVVQAMLQWRKQLAQPEFLAAWAERLAFRDEWVYIVGSTATPRRGKIAGIDPQGALCLLDRDGNEFFAQMGEVHLRLTHPLL